MKILIYAIYGIEILVGLFALGFVMAILDDLLFGEARRREQRVKMEFEMLTGKFASSSKRPGHLPGKRIIGALVVSCAVFFGVFGPCRAEARQIDTIIVHHTAGADVSAATIDSWHRARGFDSIGYHFVIRADGSIENGRPVSKVGAHAKGRNAHSIGIALTGRDYFTPEQIASLKHLVEELCADGQIKSIERHHEQCPGPGLNVEALRFFVKGNQAKPKQLASHFSDWKTASGKHVLPWTVGCASWFYPLGAKVRVSNALTGKSVICEVIDRGPRKDLVAEGRVVDLTPAAFARIGNLNDGLIPVKVETL